MFRNTFIAMSLFSVGACSFSQDIQQHAVDYNVAVERSENEMLLTNIVRASQSRPMYFTRISQLEGSLSGSAKGSLGSTINDLNTLGAPVVTNTDASFTPGLEFTRSSNPTYVVEVLDSQEFFNGFLRPISDEVFGLYISSGFTMGPLLNTFVEQADVAFATSDRSNACRLFRNHDQQAPVDAVFQSHDIGGRNVRVSYDSDSKGSGVFQRVGFKYLADIFRKNRPQYASGEEGAHLLIDINSAEDFKNLTSGKANEFKFSILDQGKAEDGSSLASSQVKVTQSAGKSIFITGSKDKLKLQEAKIRKGGVELCTTEDLTALKNIANARGETAKQVAISVQFDLSSAQGIFFALGEMVNFSRENSVEAKALGFMALNMGDVPPNGAISASYSGQNYWIDKDGAGASANNLFTLARQIFSLNTSSKNAPGARTVRLRLRGG